MELETKYIWRHQPVGLGAEIDGWRVSWLGGWSRDRLYYLVMVVKGERTPNAANVAFRCDLQFVPGTRRRCKKTCLENLRS
jgi:hypothetical protein